MKTQILHIIFLVALLFMSATSERPEDYCTEHGQIVCTHCEEFGECVLDSSSGKFKIVNNSKCPDSLYCDNTKLPNLCGNFDSSYSKCACSGDSNCGQDPNTANVYFSCGGDNKMEKGESFYCDPQNIIISTCVCSELSIETEETMAPTESTAIFEESTPSSSCSEDCPYLDDFSDPCAKYIICGSGELVSNSCPGNLCFNQEDCYCE
ncbi:UNVERIFIED_CONTAM: hypothetical protein RMT77_010624 [Armadillidium vulgare]